MKVGFEATPAGKSALGGPAGVLQEDPGQGRLGSVIPERIPDDLPTPGQLTGYGQLSPSDLQTKALPKSSPAYGPGLNTASAGEAIVERFYGGSFPTHVREASAPDIVTRIPNDLPFGGVFRGIDATMGSIAIWNDTLTVRPSIQDGKTEPVYQKLGTRAARAWFRDNGLPAPEMTDRDVFVRMVVEVTKVSGQDVKPYRHEWLEKLSVNPKGLVKGLELYLTPGDVARIERASRRATEAGQVFEKAQAILQRGGSVDELAIHLRELQRLGMLDFVDPRGMSLSMHAAALGRLDVLKAAEELGSSLDCRNPINGATLAHYAALAAGDRGSSPGRDVLTWLESKLETATLVEMLNTCNTLSGHNVWVDGLFYRNNPVCEFILGLRAKLQTQPDGPQLDLRVATARGVPPSALVGRAAGAFSEAVVAAANQNVPPQIGDAYRASRNEQWADEWVARSNVPEAQRGVRRQQMLDLIEGSGRRDPQTTTRLLGELGGLLPGGINERIGYLGQTLLHLNIHGPRAGTETATSALAFQRFLIGAGADPLVQESGLMAASPFIRAAALGQYQLAIEMAESVRNDPVRLDALVNAQGINNGRNAILDAAFGASRDPVFAQESGLDVNVASGYEFIRRMVQDLGANARVRAYDGISLDALVTRSAAQMEGAPPIPNGFTQLIQTAQVRRFVGDWFRALDGIDHEGRGRKFLPDLASGQLDIRFPGAGRITDRAGFMAWYAGIADTFEANHHTVEALKVSAKEGDAGFDVALTVRWEAETKAGEKSIQRFQQRWSVVLEGGQPKVRAYDVTPLPA